MVVMGVGSLREKVTKFACPVVSEVRGEFFQVVDMSIESKHVWQVDGEFLDGKSAVEDLMPGKVQAIIAVQFEAEGFWEILDVCKVD